MITLAWDSSGSSQAAAILVNGEVVSESWDLVPRSHSETLLPTLQALLEKAGITLGQVDLFALSVGPGSFTGLRIGIATLKAFSRVHDRPVAAASSLAALAEPFAGHRVSPCLDARLGEVFVPSFEDDPTGTQDKAMPLEDFILRLQAMPGDQTIVGSGALLHRLILEKLPQVWIPDEIQKHHIVGAAVARLGEKIFHEGRAVSGREIVPRYLRASEAENRLARSSVIARS